MALILYGVSEEPPTMAVLQALEYLELKYKFVTIDHATDDIESKQYLQKSPQKEIPVLDDNGARVPKAQRTHKLHFSNAILEYLADQYQKDETLYPRDPKARAVINQRLCFNLSTYYRHVCEYAVRSNTLEPIFFTYERSPLLLKKARIALKSFNSHLTRLGSKYVAGDHITIADFQLMATTVCLEAINFDLDGYPSIKRWYDVYKVENPKLWKILEHGMKQMSYFESLPVFDNYDHPIHPTSY
nr:unnamed protein product [Callosobruchus chinensis]